MRHLVLSRRPSSLPVRVTCRVLQVSAAGYYDWLRRQPSATEQRREELAAVIRTIHAETKGRYGSPRMHAELKARGHACSANTVARVVKSLGLRAISHRKFRVRTTDSNHESPVARNELGSAVVVGILLLGANALLFIAERTVPIGLASLLIASVPLWIVLMRTVTGDRPGRTALIGVATGFAGIAVLVRPGGEADAAGIALVLASAAIWATGSFLSSRLPLPPDAFVATAIEMLAGGLLLLPLGLLFPGDGSLDPTSWSDRSIAGLVYLVLIGSLVGYTAYVWLLAHVSISTAATYANVNPVVAILLGVIFLHEGVTWEIALGASIVLASVALVIRSEAAKVMEPFAE